MKEYQHKLAVVRGDSKADLAVKNVQVINVLSGEIHLENVAIHDGRFIGFGDYDADVIVDGDGLYMAPGFIDGHVHFESSMLTLAEFARAVLPGGTTAVVIDPHEIANVLGLDGVRYVLQSIDNLPLDVFVMLPSCVPATPLETSGASISHDDLNNLIEHERVVGIGEMMNFPAVINGNEEVHRRIEAAKWKKVDGHAPGMTGKDLNTYIFSKIDSDHESTTTVEALEKLRSGMHILIREGTSERNLEELITIVNKNNSRHFSFATDDKHPDDLLEEGLIDHSVRKAIALGMDPIMAYQMATINTASHYNLKSVGAIKPRYWADFMLLADYKQVRIESVYKKGQPVYADGKLIDIPQSNLSTVRSSMNSGEVSLNQLKVMAEGDKIRVIDILPNQIVTEEYVTTPLIRDSLVESDTANDILKIVVIERHKATGNIGKGFVRGFGLKRGAIGSTVAHDSHNIVIVGTNDLDIHAAFKHLKKNKGGFVVIDKEQVVAELPLPVAGLLSTKSFEETAADLKNLKMQVKALGGDHPAPFMILSFLSLSPIPKLKITDLGLVDVEKFAVTSLFVDRE